MISEGQRQSPSCPSYLIAAIDKYSPTTLIRSLFCLKSQEGYLIYLLIC